MKKLMIAAAIVCAAAFAQAAEYNWKMSAGWISPDDNDGLAGAKVYFFNAGITDKATLLGSLTMANIEAAAMATDKGLYAVTGGDGDFSVQSPTGDKNFVAGDAGDTASAFCLVLADAGGTTYGYAIDAGDVTISSAHGTGSPLLFTIEDTMTGEIGGAGWTAVQTGPGPVPEPTSGLLLLLGVAGLALKRKRA